MILRLLRSSQNRELRIGQKVKRYFPGYGGAIGTVKMYSVSNDFFQICSFADTGPMKRSLARALTSDLLRTTSTLARILVISQVVYRLVSISQSMGLLQAGPNIFHTFCDETQSTVFLKQSDSRSFSR
jgi:hypothetical protein